MIASARASMGARARPKRLAALGVFTGLVLTALAACGGGGDETPPPPPSFAVSGTVSDALTGGAVSQVQLTLTQSDAGAGTLTGTTTTDSSGHYTFAHVLAGSYTVAPGLANAAFVPAALPVTIAGADQSGLDFQVMQSTRIATGINFLPSTTTSGNQLRLSLLIRGDDLVFTDASDVPLKKMSLSTSTVTPLAHRFSGAQNAVLHGGAVFWVSGNQLNRTTLAGTTTLLAQGTRDPNSHITSDLVVDDVSVYWTLTNTGSACDPPCNDIIQRVPLDGSAPATLAISDRRIVALAGDADHIYWEEEMMEPVSAGCHCGSTVKSVPKADGAVVVLVDGSLNGTLPNPGPGYIPGSWLTTGGLGVTATQVVFGFAAGPDQLKAVALQGGAVTTLATGGAIKSIRVDGKRAYWIDTAAAAVDSVPLAGGGVATLAGGLTAPVSLRITGSSALWTDTGAPSGCCLQAGMGRVSAVPLTGGTVSTLLAGLDAPVTLDADGTSVVWTEEWRVGTATATGATVTTLASGIASDLPRIAADQNNIYILDADLIKVLPLAGGTVERLAPAHAGALGGLGAVSEDITTDGTNVYWSMDGNAAAVQKVAVGGGAPVTLATGPLNSTTQLCYWRIAVDAQNVYWSSGQSTSPGGCSVNKVPIEGGAMATVVDYPNLRDFTVDGDNLYFSELGSGTIQKISTDGGPLTLVGSAEGSVLTSAAGRLYWLDPHAGGVGIASEGSGMPLLFAFGLDTADPTVATEAVAIGPNGIYCTEGHAGRIDFMH